MEYSGYENEGKAKRMQHCTYCKNHGKKARKTNHKCPYETCQCLLCKLTRLSRLIMRHQQRLWRHLKDTKRREDANDAGGGGGGGGLVVLASDSAAGANGGGGGSTKQQKCDMCRNHGEITSKRAHKNACPYQNCTCALCDLTRKRRDIMRHQQRVRRSQVTSKHHNEAWEYVIQATAEMEFLNLKSTTMNADEILPPSSSDSTSPSPVSIATSTSNSNSNSNSNSTSTSTSTSTTSVSLKSEVLSNTSTPTTPVAHKPPGPPPAEMPPLEPLEDTSPVRYSPVPMGFASNAVSRPTNEPLTPTEPIPPSLGPKDIPVIDHETSWRSLKREREEGFKWSPKVHRDNDLFRNLDFMRGHQMLAVGRPEPPVPMEGISFHDSISGMDFSNNHGLPYKSLTPMMDASRLPPPAPLKKTRTEEALHFPYNPSFWGTNPVDQRVGFAPEDLQQHCYRRVIMNTSPDMRMRTPPGLIPIPQPQPPLRPRPLAPLGHHPLPSSTEWGNVNLHYLAYFLQNRGPPYSDAMTTVGPFGLHRESTFLHPSVP